MKRSLLNSFLLCLMITPFNTFVLAADITTLHSAWSELLKAHVRDGVVDYKGMKKEEQKLDDYLKGLDSTDPSTLAEKDRLALYINSYNAYTVKLILMNFKNGEPVSSIKKLGGFFSGPWKIAFCRIGGEVYTLDNIENDIIRPLFQEPRVHFAINCASKSCPPLISTAYQGEILEEQMQKNTVAFINNQNYNNLDDSVLSVSKIFKWFAADFDNVLNFIKENSRGELRVKLDMLGDGVKINYMNYNWSLNN